MLREEYMDIKLGSQGVVLQGGRLLTTKSRGESLAQRLTIRLCTVFGSWFLDTRYGVDYFNRVFEKTIPKSSIDALFQGEINSDERVQKILEFSSSIEKNEYKMKFKVKARDGVVSDEVSLTASPYGINVNK